MQQQDYEICEQLDDDDDDDDDDDNNNNNNMFRYLPDRNSCDGNSTLNGFCLELLNSWSYNQAQLRYLAFTLHYLSSTRVRGAGDITSYSINTDIAISLSLYLSLRHLLTVLTVLAIGQ